LRTRRTVERHRQNQQYILKSSLRVCHCSKHPQGRLVHRSTRIIHRASDANASIDDDNVDPEWVAQFLADQEDADATRASFRSAIRRIRIEIDEAQRDIVNPECDENQGNDNDGLELAPIERSIEDLEELDTLDALEQAALEADDGPSPTGTSDESLVYTLIALDNTLSLWIDWIMLLDGITRKKQLEIKAYFTRHFPHIGLPTVWNINKKLEGVTGILPQWEECCINSCMAFTGEYKDDSNRRCLHCNELRYFDQPLRNGQQKPRKRWLYLPLIPRLQRQYMSEKASTLSTYRAGFDGKAPGGSYTDVFDGDLYLKLRQQGLFNR